MKPPADDDAALARPGGTLPARHGTVSARSGGGLAQRACQLKPPGWLVLAALLLAAGLLCTLPFGDAAWPPVFDKAWWAQHGLQLQAWRREAPLSFTLIFMLLFTLLSALAIPGCGALALLAGTAFGTLNGALPVGVASTFGGALLAVWQDGNFSPWALAGAAVLLAATAWLTRQRLRRMSDFAGLGR